MISICSYDSSAELLRKVSDDCEDVNDFETTFFDVIVSAMNKLSMTTNYEANDVIVWERWIEWSWN